MSVPCFQVLQTGPSQAELCQLLDLIQGTAPVACIGSEADLHWAVPIWVQPFPSDFQERPLVEEE